MGVDWERKELWLSGATKGGIAQRLSTGCFILSIALIFVGCNFAGDASAVYWAFVATHALVYTGFVVGAVADGLARRRFNGKRLVCTVTLGFMYPVLCPIFMSAVVAANRSQEWQLGHPIRA